MPRRFMPRGVSGDGPSGKEGRGHTGGDDVVRRATTTGTRPGRKEDEKEARECEQRIGPDLSQPRRYKVNRPPAPVQWY
ncbi:hypothetical protein K0M31_001661 [Melipona bicolor]|uniref:Uncharacterized protein n=1 Tax=Melipona bicolor TaxID=60889 RepID=A0AA40KY02_9HYME|nr:hypothetical protein K0M31_001661 [Melipona bicolor]